MFELNLKALVVSDDPLFARSLCRDLARFSVAVEWARIGHVTVDVPDLIDQDIILLDAHSDFSKIKSLIGDLRQSESTIPLIVLHSVNSCDDQVHVLDLGADDCVPRRVDLLVLLARMRAVVRRQRGQTRTVLEVGPIALDVFKREVVYGTKRAVLPPREFALLHYLVENPGIVMSRSRLHDHLYGDSAIVSLSTVDVLIHYIRRKLGGDIILNVRKSGWLISSAI